MVRATYIWKQMKAGEAGHAEGMRGMLGFAECRKHTDEVCFVFKS